MFRYELVLRDVHEQILLLKGLNDAGQYDRHDLQRRGRDTLLGDEDACVKVVLVDVLRKGAHLLNADGGFSAEFDPDGADGSGWCRIDGGGQRGVFLDHGRRGFEGGGHLLAVGATERVGEARAKFIEADGLLILC